MQVTAGRVRREKNVWDSRLAGNERHLLGLPTGRRFNIRRHSFGMIVSYPKVVFNDKTLLGNHNMFGMPTCVGRTITMKLATGNGLAILRIV